MHRSLRTQLLRCVTAFTVVHATAALAQPTANKKLNDQEKAQARALYDEGLRHYNVAEYAEAITAFKATYLLSGDPKLLFNVAQSYRLSGDCEQALRFYKNFQREAPGAANLAEVDAAISKCDSVPSTPVAAAPAERPPVVVEPAPSAPAVVPLTSQVAAPGAPVGLSRAPAENRGHGRRVAGVTMAGLGVAAAATGLVLGLSGRAQLNQLDAREGEWGPEEKRKEANARRMQTAGQIVIGVGATALVAGIVVYLTGNSQDRSSSQVALAPDRHGGQMVWSCVF
jgi:tetratricopeptide (TPR) repeat protein